MNYVIAIPTYKRHLSLRQKTYALLQRHCLLHLTTLFVVPEEELLYSQEYPDLNIVVGVKGLHQQREIIFNHYPSDTNILQMDDDVDSIIDSTRKELQDLNKLIIEGFEGAREVGARLWGIYPIDNPFFFSKDSTNLKFICGPFFGLIKRPGTSAPPLKESIKEDYYRTCWCYSQDKVVLRLNSYGVRTKYYTNKGGLNDERTNQSICDSAEILKTDFPNWVSTYIRKGRTEIRLRGK